MAGTKKNGKAAKKPKAKGTSRESSLTEIRLQGFKSFRDETRIPIRPLTLLAGANSSGKSSAIQSLLLLKQTLEATYDPGPLLLNGPNVRFSLVDQMLWRGESKKERADDLSIGLKSLDGNDVRLSFRPAPPGGINLEKLTYHGYGPAYDLRPDMRGADVREILKTREWSQEGASTHLDRKDFDFRVDRERCSFVAKAIEKGPMLGRAGWSTYVLDPFSTVAPIAHDLIHVPGLRGNPERSYPTAQVGPRFPGPFQHYVATLVVTWSEAGDGRLEQLDDAVFALGLTGRVEARRLDDTAIELRVGRLPPPLKSAPGDLVNIADVGFGVSQTLPVVVALLAAAPGQVVYLEQPEIHLHPRAQVALARLLLDAAKRGVTVIAETHSDLLLRSVQRAVAAGEADPSLVALHWFERDKDGASKLSTAHLDAAGTYGDWPVDFADVDMKLESSFLDASLRHPA